MIFIFFILGIFVGSFLNVCIYRFNTGLSIYSGRSRCFSCSKKLSFFELVPLFSFIFQGGRCMSCKSKISIQYPLVEFFTGILFVLAFLKNTDTVFLIVLDIIVFCFLVLIFVYDGKHKIIPNFFVYSFIFFSILRFLYTTNVPHGDFFIDLISPFLFFIAFWILWFLSKGRLIGFADSKMVFGIGFFFGFVKGISAIILSFWVGAIYSMTLLLMQKMNIYNSSVKINRHTEIPFGPFLVIGFILEYWFGFDLMHLTYFLN